MGLWCWGGDGGGGLREHGEGRRRMTERRKEKFRDNFSGR